MKMTNLLFINSLEACNQEEKDNKTRVSVLISTLNKLQLSICADSISDNSFLKTIVSNSITGYTML